MKFKKVEIQAFRAYRDIKDGTFDFTTAANEVADFISIYAPNGFGKSTFFDAVEWGFTQNLERLLRKDRFRTSKATERQTTASNRDTLREAKEGFVRLYVTTESSPIERNIPVTRHYQPDLKEKDKKTTVKRIYFRDLILAQEKISALLKEDDESVRYAKYIESFGDINLNSNYQLITELIRHNNSKIDSLTQALNDIRQNNDFEFDPEILSKINEEIELLNQQGEHIPLVEFDWTEKQILLLANLINWRIIDLQYVISKAKEKIDTIQALKAALETDIGNLTKDEFEKRLDDAISTCQKHLLPMESHLQSFEKVKAYKENVTPFLKHDAIMRKEQDLLEEKLFLETHVRPQLEKERAALADFIKRQIESSFHTKLINTFYKKIDPTPDYKDIVVVCDFNAEKPRLNILIPDENDEQPVVPSIYFSAPQLNILSFSIFLSKVLKMKDDDDKPVDCIFIDDPIQSMDSIHILSTIDLLRSIIIRTGKQIIFSTHDENIHNLLQRKMPPNKFKAKYIELETFGKVKQ